MIPKALQPKGIFVSIYGGILALVVLVGFAAYLMMSVIREDRAHRYMENMSTAVLHGAVIALARQPEAVYEIWLRDAAMLLDAPLNLLSELPFVVSEKEAERLSKGFAIVREYKGQRNIYIRLPMAGPERYLRTQIDIIGEQQARAAANFYLEDLSHYPEQETLRLQTLAPYVGFPMRLADMTQLKLDSDQLSRLSQDEIVVSFSGLATGGTRSSMVILAPSQTELGKVLVLGPLQLFDPMPIQSVLLASVLALLLITLGSYWLIHRVESKLKTLGGTVKRIREGDLSARAEVVGADEIAQLAETVNQMSAHIKRLLDTQRELTQAVSHELRTPLARLRFGIEMMADSPDQDERFHQVDQLNEDIDQLNQLIDEILTYANLQQARPQMDFELTDMADLVARIKRETDALGKPIAFKARCDENLEMMTVPRYAHRVIQNLVGNALRYADQQVWLTVERTDQATVEIRVEDDGQGIPEAQRERVFQPFTRLDDSRTRSTGGYGLGLSIVSRIVHWFEGTIRVDRSQALGGASFIMRLPITPEGNASALT